MILNPENIDLAFRGFKTLYTMAYDKAPIYYDKIAMTVPSSARDEGYGWLSQFPQFREWLGGDRIPKDMSAHGFTITYRKFESTVSIKREDFADDRLGVFSPIFSEMGQRSRQHPDELVFPLLKSGFSTLCYDGQNYFDTDHPAVDEAGGAITVSNMQDGPGPMWVLMDTSRFIKPIIWQEREKYDLLSVTDPKNFGVFMTDVYHFGVRARVNAGFGLWQLSYASKQPLDAANYKLARATMTQLRGDQGRLLGIKGTTLVVGSTLEEAGLTLLNGETYNGGDSNPWKGTADLVVTPYL